MKTILVATDFSPAGNNASRYALELAKGMNATLVLCHLFQGVPVTYFEVPAGVGIEDGRDFHRTRLKQLATDLDPSGAASIETLLLEEGGAEGILAAAGEKGAGLIVVGMKSGERRLRWILGSMVTSMARRSRIPMLVIPEETPFTEPFLLALGIEGDIQGTELDAVNPLLEIGNRYLCQLYLVRAVTDPGRQPADLRDAPKHLIQKMEGLRPIYSHSEGKDVADALNNFIGNRLIDIMAILPHRHHFLERMLKGTITKALAFRAHVPLLLLPGGEEKGASG